MNFTTTVLIPLHSSMPFLEIVEKNLRALASSCSIIVSDPFRNDIAFDELQSRWKSQPNIVFLGKRELEPGWIAHYNDLVTHVETPFFMWLAHDDEIDASYIEKCEGTLVADDTLSACVGHVQCIEGEGFLELPQPLFPQSAVLEHYQFTANGLLEKWNLGILFRAVFRASSVTKIRESFHGDWWSDIVWAYGFCLLHKVAQEASAVYFKRFYESSTHQRWDHELFWSAVPPFLHAQIVEHLSDSPISPQAAQELTEIVSRHSVAQVRKLSSEVEALTSQNALLVDEIESIQKSNSWRVTKPLRRLRNLLGK